MPPPPTRCSRCSWAKPSNRGASSSSAMPSRFATSTITPDPVETILQFGAGRFLRAFADLFVHQARAAGQPVGRIVVVQSTAGDRSNGLRRQGCRYHVAIRGLQGGQEIDTV